MWPEPGKKIQGLLLLISLLREARSGGNEKGYELSVQEIPKVLQMPNRKEVKLNSVF